jgi:pimeloyl-ACP methyl ester carboxylesterase/DNA-binding CsgD family transcriptional regulator
VTPVDATTRQQIRYLRTQDGVQIAWADAGAGPILVKGANWLTHLEYDWESPVWRHWLRFLTAHFHLIRYDERGCGMTDWDVGDFACERWVEDLETVIETAVPPDRKMFLLGISQGGAACIPYAARHPDRVAGLILYGTYAKGYSRRGDDAAEKECLAIAELARIGWGRDNPVFRQIFTARFIPDAQAEQVNWFNDLCKKTTSPAIAAELLIARGRVEVSEFLPQVRVPTLVMHARGDQVVPFAAGRYVATHIPGAQFVELESRNHVLLEGEPAWERFKQVVLEFAGLAPEPAGEDAAFAALSPREREILSLMSEGLGNAEIGERLAISEKTVRNHISKVFDKLGVWTRAQAIVFARDRGFGT